MIEGPEEFLISRTDRKLDSGVSGDELHVDNPNIDQIRPFFNDLYKLWNADVL